MSWDNIQLTVYYKSGSNINAPLQISLKDCQVFQIAPDLFYVSFKSEQGKTRVFTVFTQY